MPAYGRLLTLLCESCYASAFVSFPFHVDRCSLGLIVRRFFLGFVVAGIPLFVCVGHERHERGHLDCAGGNGDCGVFRA